MRSLPPKVVLRLGSHAEKEYFEKLAGQLDAIMFGGNLLEITPSATTSLLALLNSKRGQKGPVPYYLDPMTYCYGAYIDPESGRKRTDLHALKSTRKDRKTKKNFTAVKESYDTLARQLGSKFEMAINDGVVCTAIDPMEMPPSERNDFCQDVINYQLNRIEEIVAQETPEDDEVIRAIFSGVGKPAAVFAPYFYINEKWAKVGLEATMDFAERTVKLNSTIPVHVVLCASSSVLSNSEQFDYICNQLPKTGAKGVWFWFDGFDESKATAEQLLAFRNIVRNISSSMEVYNLHGGYFSLLLSHDGLTGISHGVGYGESKPVAQVISAAAPTVRYYLPSIYKRVGVLEIQRCYPDVEIRNADHFYLKVCDCQICKGVIGKELDRFANFGAMHRANEKSKKDSQTPAAAKMCRYHFLINRLKERNSVAAIKADERSSHIKNNAAIWRGCYSLRQYLSEVDRVGYLERWEQTFE